jgi:hypothetical protein
MMYFKHIIQGDIHMAAEADSWDLQEDSRPEMWSSCWPWLL